jgi:hypothetical protein
MAALTAEAKAFFSDLKSDVKGWSEFFAGLTFGQELREMDAPHASVIEAIKAGMAKQNIPRKDLELYLAHMFNGLIHSVLSDIDGASASADNGRQFWLVDKKGKEICACLHEDYVFLGDDT